MGRPNKKQKAPPPQGLHYIDAWAEKRGLIQADFVRSLNVDKGTVSRWFDGKMPDETNLPRIAVFLEVGIDDLFRPPDVEAKVYQDVPILSSVSAGALTKPDVSEEQIGKIKVGGLDPKGDWIALRVEGDSMDRISPPDSVILVNRKEKRLVPNACYIVADGEDGVTYKRFRHSPNRLEPVSTNPAHEPIYFEHDPTVIGRVRKTILDM